MSRPKKENEKVTIQDCEGIVFSNEKKALLVGNKLWDEDKWIPCSQIDVDSECYMPNTEGTLIVPRWLAEKENLV